MKKRRKFFKFFACFSNGNDDDSEMFVSANHNKPVSFDNLNDNRLLPKSSTHNRIYSSTPCFATNNILAQNLVSISTTELRLTAATSANASESLISEAMNVSYEPLSEILHESSDVTNRQNQAHPPLAQQEDLPEEEQVSGSSYDNVSKKSVESNENNKNDFLPTNHDNNNIDGDQYNATQQQQQQVIEDKDIIDASENSELTKQKEQASGESSDEDDEVAKNLQKRKYVIAELIETERDYVKDLGIIVEDYISIIQNQVLPAPSGFEGKDKIIFGNIHQIYDFHKRIFQQELLECQEDPHRLGSIFIRYERRLHMYVKYCENKPKSEFLVAEYIDYCEEIRQKLGHRLQLPDLLIKPVQRIMKYQLLLKDILKFSARAGEDVTDLEKAVEVMKVIPKAADDMMNVGRLQGFEGKITAQGLLLMQDILYVAEVNKSSNVNKLDRSLQFKERRTFLFEQMIIFSDEIDKKKNNMSNPGYIFKNSILINRMSMEEETNDDPPSFTLIDKNQGSDLRLVCHAPTPEMTLNWISHIRNLLDMQGDFLKALVSPIEYQKEQKNRNITKEFSEPDISCLQIHHSTSQQQQQQQHYQQQQQPQSKSSKKQKHKTSSSSHVLRKTHSQPKSNVDSCIPVSTSPGKHHRTSSNPAIKTFKIKDGKESAMAFIESFLDKTTKNILEDHSHKESRCRSESPANIKRSIFDGLRSTFLPFKSQSQEDLKSRISGNFSKKHPVTSTHTPVSTPSSKSKSFFPPMMNSKTEDSQTCQTTNSSLSSVVATSSTTSTTTTTTQSTCSKNKHEYEMITKSITTSAVDSSEVKPSGHSIDQEIDHQNIQSSRNIDCRSNFGTHIIDTSSIVDDSNNSNNNNNNNNKTRKIQTYETAGEIIPEKSGENSDYFLRLHSFDKIDSHQQKLHQLRRHESERRQTSIEGVRTNSGLTSSLKLGGRSTYHQFINSNLGSNPDKCQTGCDVSKLFHCDSDPSIKGAENCPNSYFKNTEAVVPPRFIKGLTDVRICDGNNAIFFCRVCGQPRPTVVWSGPGSSTITSLSNRFTVTYFDDGLARLELHNVNFDDVGEYSCTATNAAGSLKTSAILSVVTDI